MFLLRCEPHAIAACADGMAAQVFGVATEDMDALTFGTPRLIRNLMAPASAKTTVTEYDYDKVGFDKVGP